MKYYIFKSIDNETISYGFIPEDKISEESKPFAFKVIDELPSPIDLGGAPLEYRIAYNEVEDTFYWEVVGE